jgi:predicted CxxxxCH...CXXCH cytochrome family protein
MLTAAVVVIGFSASGHAGRQTFNTAGTFTVPAGVNQITVEAWGAGGGGGGGAGKQTGTGGGGGGAYARSVLSVTPSTGSPVMVGAGGASDTAGSSSTFDANVVVAAGGSAGSAAGTGGAGGSTGASTGDVVYAGGVGAAGVNNPNGYGGGGGSSAGTASAGTAATNGTGATSPAGGGNGGDGATAAGGAGSAGLAPGGGGGGSMRTGGPVVGGSGANGRVTVNFGPTVTINQASGQADPAGSVPVSFDVVFSEAVSGFTTASVSLSGSATGLSVSGVSGSGTTYTITASATGSGTIIAIVNAGGAQDSFGNDCFASTSTDNSVTYSNAAPPTVTIDQAAAQSDPTNGTMAYTVVFSEDVTGFAAGDVVITGTAVANVSSVTGGPASYTVNVSGLDSGTVIADIPAGATTSSSSGLSSLASTSTDNIITFDNLKPGVAINQGGAQADPTTGSPIVFDVVFSEVVTGFATGDVSLSGTATANVSSVSGSGTTYSVEVTPTTNGTVIAAILAGGASDSAGNTNSASSSSDNEVQFDGAGCVDSTPSTITIAASQTVSGAAVDLTTLYSTTGNVALFTYTIEAVGVDSPWNSANYGTTGAETVTLVVSGIDPDCGGSALSDTNTITVDNTSINFIMHNSDTTSSSKWQVDGGWGITDGKYGAFSCATCHTRTTTNIKRIKETIEVPNGTDNWPNASTQVTVVYTSAVDGASDMGDDTVEHATSNKVCEVCHSQNNFHNYNTADNLANGGDNGHANLSDCVGCHPHSVGFKAPGCNSCHGNPPTSAANLVFSPSRTDATTPESAGAHIQHAVYQGMDCLTCHKGNTMPMVSKKIQMGIEASPATVPGFVGTSASGTLEVPEDVRLSNGYTLVSSDAGTTVTKVANDNLNCTVYCHGDWTGSAGLVTTPSWVGVGQAACGTCHGADGANTPATGSHIVHAANSGSVKLSCGKCHPIYSDHLDGDVAWQLATGDSRIGASATYRGAASGTTGGLAPSATFGTCASIYCHGTDTPTWGGAALGCAGCHSASSSLPATHGVHYNSATVATVNTTANSSTATNYVFQCGTCHSTAGTSHAYGVVSGIQSAEVSLANGGTYTAGGALLGSEGVFNYTGGTCGFNSCHNNGKAVAGAPNSVATWGSSLPTDCTGCHGNSPTSAVPMSSVAHGKHLLSSVTNDLCCNDCHSSTVIDDQMIDDKTKHVDGIRDVHVAAEFDSDVDSTNNWNGTSCTSVYCHSDGKASLTYQTITWTDTAVCNTCHDNAGTSSNLSASHLAHIGTDPSDTNKQFGYTCADCHAQTASSNSVISVKSNHVNKNRDVAVAIAHGGDAGIGTDFGEDTVTPRPDSCGTTNCHGTSSPSWVAGATTGDCSSCHGMSDPAKTGRDTNGDTLDSDPQVGAHAAHINAQNGYASPITCDQCHNSTYTEILGQTTYVNKVNAVGHIDSAPPAEVSYGSIATAAAAATNYSGVTGVCANYCHGGTLANGFDTNPGWDQSAYLSGSFSATGDCNRCHGAPPLITGHTGSETLADCGICHTVTMTAGIDTAFADPSKHIDGVLQVNATCGTCHGQLPPNTGSHPKHGIHLEQDLGLPPGNLDGGLADWTAANYPTCAVCHDMTIMDNHLGGASDILGANKPDEAFAPDYPSAGVSYPVYNPTTQSCTNARCHFQPSPDWAP